MKPMKPITLILFSVLLITTSGQLSCWAGADEAPNNITVSVDYSVIYNEEPPDRKSRVAYLGSVAYCNILSDYAAQNMVRWLKRNRIPANIIEDKSTGLTRSNKYHLKITFTAVDKIWDMYMRNFIGKWAGIATMSFRYNLFTEDGQLLATWDDSAGKMDGYQYTIEKMNKRSIAKIKKALKDG